MEGLEGGGDGLERMERTDWRRMEGTDWTGRKQENESRFERLARLIQPADGTCMATKGAEARLLSYQYGSFSQIKPILQWSQWCR